MATNLCYKDERDPAYGRKLIQKTDLPLQEIFALNRMQKKLPLHETMINHLRRANLIEEHEPNLHASAMVADDSESKADYIPTHTQDEEFYAKLVLDYLVKFNQATRNENDKLLLPILSDTLTSDQKITKINNLLTKMRRKKINR